MISLQELGAKTVESKSVWEQTGNAINVTVGQDGIELREGDYGLFLMQRANGQVSFVNVRRGVGRKDTYLVSKFVASRDWVDDDGNVKIHKGDTSVMAF